jgi:hypothetical protein
MATRIEHPERCLWRLNELESFGTITKRINKLNDLEEMRSHAIYHNYYNEDVIYLI